MTLASFRKESFTTTHQTAFKSSLKQQLGITTLSDNSIVLTIADNVVVATSKRVRRRLSGGGITISYTITGVSETVATSATATLADGSTANAFTVLLAREMQSAGAAAPAGGWGALSVDVGAVVTSSSPPTPVPTPVPPVPTPAPKIGGGNLVGIPLSGASSLNANVLAVVLSTVLVLWASTAV
jgi:hypothetical protein